MACIVDLSCLPFPLDFYLQFKNGFISSRENSSSIIKSVFDTMSYSNVPGSNRLRDWIFI